MLLWDEAVHVEAQQPPLPTRLPNKYKECKGVVGSKTLEQYMDKHHHLQYENFEKVW